MSLPLTIFILTGILFFTWVASSRSPSVFVWRKLSEAGIRGKVTLIYTCQGSPE